jgi:hypothetical protein
VAAHQGRREFRLKFVAEPSAPNEFEMDPELNAKFRRWKRRTKNVDTDKPLSRHGRRISG